VETIKKISTRIRIPRPSCIVLLNVAALGVIAIVLSTRVSHDHQSEIASMLRASHRLVKTIVVNCDLAKDCGVTSQRFALQEVPLGYTHSAALCPGRFE
jgi:hypothetical protein